MQFFAPMKTSNFSNYIKPASYFQYLPGKIYIALIFGNFSGESFPRFSRDMPDTPQNRRDSRLTAGARCDIMLKQIIKRSRSDL